MSPPFNKSRRSTPQELDLDKQVKNLFFRFLVHGYFYKEKSPTMITRFKYIENLRALQPKTQLFSTLATSRENWSRLKRVSKPTTIEEIFNNNRRDLTTIEENSNKNRRDSEQIEEVSSNIVNYFQKHSKKFSTAIVKISKTVEEINQHYIAAIRHSQSLTKGSCKYLYSLSSVSFYI